MPGVTIEAPKTPDGFLLVDPKILKDIHFLLTDETLAPGEVREVNFGPVQDRTGLLIVARARYDPASTAGVRINWLYSYDGINYDTLADSEAEGNYFEPTFAAGETRQRSTILAFLSPYVRFRIENLDTTYSVVVTLALVAVK